MIAKNLQAALPFFSTRLGPEMLFSACRCSPGYGGPSKASGLCRAKETHRQARQFPGLAEWVIVLVSEMVS